MNAVASSLSQPQDTNLVWKLDEFENKARACDFVRAFADNLCVFSGVVEKIYSNYTVDMPAERHRSLVILPNPYAYHDIFHDVPVEAVANTGLLLKFGRRQGMNVPLLSLPVNHQGTIVYKDFPVKFALDMIRKTYRKSNRAFLPVVTKGDLQRVSGDLPCLKLKNLNSAILTSKSRLEVKLLEDVILEKLKTLCDVTLSDF